MNREIVERWIADLRTNPPQAKGVLFDGKGHCCLGRLCEILEMKPVKKEVEEGDEREVWQYDNMEFLLPFSIQQQAEMKSEDGSYGDTNLARDNDSGKSFAEIADIIEAHIDEL